MTSDTFWPTTARCLHCGRYVKRDLINIVNHTHKDCPKAEYTKGFLDGMLSVYSNIKLNH